MPSLSGAIRDALDMNDARQTAVVLTRALQMEAGRRISAGDDDADLARWLLTDAGAVVAAILNEQTAYRSDVQAKARQAEMIRVQRLK